MKRILVTILSILYMAAATGATVHIHYCMGRLVGASLNHNDGDDCSKCGMKKTQKKGCCKDEHKTFKTSDHQYAKVAADFSAQQVSILPPTWYNLYSESVNDYYTYSATPIHGPPDLANHSPIYLLVRNFRI